MESVCDIHMYVNGNPVTLQSTPLMSLAGILREKLGLTGTKVGCNTGECGACTVILNGKAVASCMVIAGQLDGADVRTIEGIGSEQALHPLQQVFIEEGAIQCGYCTPGIIMSAVALLEETVHPSDAQIRDAIAGNLCRCTGYQKIIRAIQRYAETR